jgi:hypothetical protein
MKMVLDHFFEYFYGLNRPENLLRLVSLYSKVCHLERVTGNSLHLCHRKQGTVSHM